LGEGSFGRVFLGQHEQTNEEVAIKCIDMAKLQNPLLIESLKTEINVMRELKSPNIVRLYDVI
jgi:serine/threonine protein kinase